MRKCSIILGLALTLTALFSGCGGGSGDSSSSSGTISMNITDAKPALPDTRVESVSITFDEVSVHKSGGGWTTLAIAAQPYTLDLYQFSDGGTTQFVPPVQLESGKYTQVRIGVSSGVIRIGGENHPLEIPSASLKTDKNFEFNVAGGGAVDLTVDFDLSQSIVLTGSGTYQLKPVLHVNTTAEAATIRGTIDFGGSTQATIIVTWDKNGDGNFQPASDRDPDEEYTRLVVQNSDAAPFEIFWLVPNEGYFVQVLLGANAQAPARDTGRMYVQAADLPPGATYNLGNSI